MALGACHRNVVTLVVREAILLASGGIAVGTLLALGFTHLLAKLLYGVTPTDGITFVSAPAILLGVALLSAWLPARYAARIDPIRALRQD
jgi:ABC-type antimicrobial peptide transport system permease subunit